MLAKNYYFYHTSWPLLVKDPDIYWDLGVFKTNHMKIKNIKGERIKLRPFRSADAATFARWFKDPEVVRYLDRSIWREKVDSLKKEIREFAQPDNNKLRWAIENTEGRLIGRVGVNWDKYNRIATLVIMIGEKDEWGKGYATEAIILVGKYVFNKLKAHRWDLLVSEKNKPALRIYRRIGFKKEGQQREAEWDWLNKRSKEKYNNVVYMSMLEKEWFKHYGEDE